MDDAFEIEECEFFRILKDKCASLYKKATENGWLICVPQPLALQYMNITPQLLKAHVLRPSPYFIGFFVTATEKTVEYIEADGVLITRQGFDFPDRIRILRDERFYNKKLKPYRVMVIERPFEGVPEPRMRRQHSSSFSLSVPKEGFETLHQLKTFLRQQVPSEQYFIDLETEVQSFVDRYVFIAGYEKQCATQLMELYEDFASRALEDSPTLAVAARGSSRVMETVHHAVHSWIMAESYAKFMPLFWERFQQDDMDMLQIMEGLDDVPLSHYGSSSRFTNFVVPESAITALSSLDVCTTVYEKLVHLRTAVRQITLSAYSISRASPPLSDSGPALLLEVASPSRVEVEPLTADDLIPLMAYAVAKAHPSHIFANIEFMSSLQIPECSSTELGYNLVSLHAAVSHIRTVHENRQNESSEYVAAVVRSPVDDDGLSDKKRMLMSLLLESPHDPKQADRSEEAARRARRHTLFDVKPEDLKAEFERFSRETSIPSPQTSQVAQASAALQRPNPARSQSFGGSLRSERVINIVAETTKTQDPLSSDDLGDFLGSLLSD